MWLWLLQSICDAVSDIYWKKALETSRMDKAVFMFLGQIGVLVWGLLLFLLGKSAFSFGHWIEFAILVWIVLSSFVSTSLWQVVYLEEKISAIIPYQNINSIITIVLGFFIFSDASMTSFLIALLTMAIILGASINPKTFTFPKSFPKIFLASSISAARSLVAVYMIKEITSEAYFTLNGVIAASFLLIPIIARSKLPDFMKWDRQFYSNRMLASFIGAASELIWIYLIEDLGIILSTLLSFFGVGIALVLSYFMLKDVPSKKDVTLALVTSALVGLGFYFK